MLWTGLKSQETQLVIGADNAHVTMELALSAGVGWGLLLAFAQVEFKVLSPCSHLSDEHLFEHKSHLHLFPRCGEYKTAIGKTRGRKGYP